MTDSFSVLTYIAHAVVKKFTHCTGMVSLVTEYVSKPQIQLVALLEHLTGEYQGFIAAPSWVGLQLYSEYLIRVNTKS